MSVGDGIAVKGLFFDSLAQIPGEVAAEEATLWNAFKFILMLWPLWSIWTDMRSYLNVVRLSVPFTLASTDYTVCPQSGTDDATQRIYILLTSILLIGYTAQSASIELLQDKNEQMFIPSQGYEALLGRPHSCWLQKVSVSSNSYGMHGTFQAQIFAPCSSPHSHPFRHLLPSAQSRHLYCHNGDIHLGMSLDIIRKYIAGILVSIFGADGTNKHHLSFLLSRSDMLSKGRLRSTFLWPARFSLALLISPLSRKLVSEMNGCDAVWVSF